MCKEPHSWVIELCIRALKCIEMPHRMFEVTLHACPSRQPLARMGVDEIGVRISLLWSQVGHGKTTQTWVQCALKMDVPISDLRWFKYQMALQSIYFLQSFSRWFGEATNPGATIDTKKGSVGVLVVDIPSRDVVAHYISVSEVWIVFPSEKWEEDPWLLSYCKL